MRTDLRSDDAFTKITQLDYLIAMTQKIIFATIGISISFFLNGPAAATDACSARAVTSIANVTVSDGRTYGVHTRFHSKNSAWMEFVRPDGTEIAVEGPFSWVRDDKGDRLGGDFQKLFSLGHQFTAFALFFDEIVSDSMPVESVEFGDGVYNGTIGALPSGGTATMFVEPTTGNPIGIRYQYPEIDPINVFFGDWRSHQGADVPFQVMIDDGEREFDYRYSEIDINDKNPGWYFDSGEAPAVDEIQIYRLHRKLLIAHCEGDAAAMASLTGPETVIANRGDLFMSSSSETGVRFESVFNRVDYTNYIDLTDPVIEVSEGGDLGWAAVNVRTIGTDQSNGEAFDYQWAWVMLARKIDGEWRSVGNASNLKQE